MSRALFVSTRSLEGVDRVLATRLSLIRALAAFRGSSLVLVIRLSLSVPKFGRAMPFARHRIASKCDVGFERYSIISFSLVSTRTTNLKSLNMLWSPDLQTAGYSCVRLKQTFIHECSLGIQIQNKLMFYHLKIRRCVS